MLSSAGLSLRRWASGCQRGRRTVATVISGNKTSQMVRERLKKDVEKMKKEAPGFRPGLVVLQVGDRDDSNLYISMKLKAAAEIGIDANHIRLPRSATEDEVLKAIVSVNENPAVHGLIVQLPLDSDHKIDTEAVTDAVSPLKDVDGLTSINAGKLSRGDLGQCFIPCTPNGCMELIRQTGVEVAGKNVVVIGRSKIVGAPMHDLLLWSHGTVTTCHSKTQDLAAEVGRADILVVGAGKAEMVKGDWVKEGAVVIDCGINHIPDDSKPSGQRVVGDVHYPSAKERAGFITPVPGGVGPMTVAMLMENTVQSAWRFLKRHQSGKWNLSSTSVNPQTPQPSDGAIAHSCTPKAVGRLVREVGLFSGEAVPYGPFRAKVSTEARKRLKLQRDGRYVVVTGVARQGAGSRIVSIGLTDALAAHLHVNSMGCLTHRTGGVFGGGYSQVFPMDEVSAMLDSDFYAVTTASKLIDTALRERLEPSTEHTLEKQLSSDILSVLAVSQSQQDLSNRLAKLVVATGPDNTPVTTNDLGISRVLAALLRDTLKPTLKQTLEGSPVFVHTNPLSGSSRCDSPVMADHIALKLVGPEGIVVTETGSIDNFVHMKCRRAGLQPDVVVMVATVAGIRKLGGKAKLKKKIWLPDYRISPKFDSKALQEGCRRLNTLIQRATLFGLPVVFAVNVFSSDTTEDIELLCSQAELGGAVEAVPCSSWSLGGAGAVQLGRAVQRATQSKHKVNFLYDMEMSIEEKIRSVAHSMYGAAEVKLLPQAQRKVALFTQQGLSGLPVSLSPSQHDVPVREGLLTIQDLRANTGARFLSALYDTSPPSTLTLTQTPPPCLYDIDLYPENQ